MIRRIGLQQGHVRLLQQDLDRAVGRPVVEYDEVPYAHLAMMDKKRFEPGLAVSHDADDDHVVRIAADLERTVKVLDFGGQKHAPETELNDIQFVQPTYKRSKSALDHGANLIICNIIRGSSSVVPSDKCHKLWIPGPFRQEWIGQKGICSNAKHAFC